MTTPRQVKRYDLHQLVRAVATFLGTDNLTGVIPSQVTFLLQNPLGSVSTYVFGQAGASIQAAASNSYAKDFTVDQVGSWFYRWEATGVGQSAEEWSLIVQPSFIL